MTVDVQALDPHHTAADLLGVIDAPIEVALAKLTADAYAAGVYAGQAEGLDRTAERVFLSLIADVGAAALTSGHGEPLETVARRAYAVAEAIHAVRRERAET